MKFRLIMSLVVIVISALAFLVMNTESSTPKPAAQKSSQPNAFKR